MMKPFFSLIHAILLLSLGTCVELRAEPSPVSALPLKTLSGKRKLVVGVYINQPFAYQNKEGYQGFCIDLWKEIAANLNLQFEFVPYATVSEVLNAAGQNKVDVALGNISITSDRLKIADFSQPYLQGGLQIMVDEKRAASWQRLWNGLRDSGHLKIFGIGIAVILIGTLLLTFGERRWNKEFHPDWPNGMAESFYHVMSIAMTGKSTHKGLPGPFGKILAGIWLAFGVGVVAYITSSFTSVMTVNRLHGIIDGPKDLPGHHVGAIGGTLSQKYCEDQNLNTTVYSNLPEAVKALTRHEIDAIVFDAMTLQWYDNAHPELPLTEVGPTFLKKGYGFAVPIKSPLRHDINQSLLKQQESGFTETLRKQYFGEIE
ncbi:MAG: transporter substrate-binding domain-containing protein [bacterium]